MVDLKIEQNEYIIRQTRAAWRFDGNEERELQSLFLTNKHLISVYEKTMALFFKSEPVVDKRPLSSINIINGVLQVNYIMDDNFGESLQILYNNGSEELYFFGDAPKSEYQQWEGAIKKAIIENNKTCMKKDKISVPPLIAEDNKKFVQIMADEERVDEKKNLLLFCASCGEKNNIGARFCQSCGTPLDIETKVEQTEEPHRENITNLRSERRQEFVGKIIKCPNCGEILKSFVTVCPLCGYELRDSKSSSAVREFARKLEENESTRQASSKISGIANAFGLGIVNKTDKEKENLIRNFSIPNNKEDIFEFMILAASNIDATAFSNVNSDGITNFGDKQVMLRISKAWLAKLEQAYNKAKLSFGTDSDFEKIERIYITITKEIRKVKIKGAATLFGLFALLLAIPMFIVIPLRVYESSVEKKLNATVQEIQTDLEQGDYDNALIKANTLHYDEHISSGKAKDWDEQREAIIDLINEKKNER